MREIALQRPARLVEFYMNLYAILRARLRKTDFVARMNDHRIVAILAGNDGRGDKDQSLIDYLNVEVKSLQESYRIFQNEESRPEGFRVMRYPAEDRAIWDILGIEPAVFETPDAPLVEPEAA
jgi:hypothetical protein